MAVGEWHAATVGPTTRAPPISSSVSRPGTPEEHVVRTTQRIRPDRLANSMPEPATAALAARTSTVPACLREVWAIAVITILLACGTAVVYLTGGTSYAFPLFSSSRCW